jgi:hypothetical protein
MRAECDAEDAELVPDTRVVALAEAVVGRFFSTTLRMVLVRSLSPGIVQTTAQT